MLDAFTYNDDGTLSSRTEGSGDSSAAYSWDAVGQLTGQSDVIADEGNNVSWAFTLNPASQITSDARTETSNAGVYPEPRRRRRRRAYTGLIAVNRNYGVNGLNQYTSAGPASFTYDANGNLTADGTNAYVYDIENRLVKATAASVTTNLLYDPLGRLFQTDQGTSATTTRFLYDGDAMVAEFSNLNVMTARYVHGSNAAADDPLVWYTGTGSNTKRWLHADHLGSVIAVTDNDGESFAKNAYDEYGMPGSANVGRFQFTGQAYIPELGLYYYKARFYSATLGRFLQVDPIGYDDQVNLYVYVANDPVNRSDPTGLYQTNCATDTACNAAVGRFETQRQANLNAKDSSVVASAKAYGDPGQKNGVSVNFLSNRQMDQKHGEGRSGGTSGDFLGSKAKTTVDIRIGLSGKGLGQTVAHEGTHVAQRTALAATYNSTTDRYGSSANLTVLQSERQAYGVGQNVKPYEGFTTPREMDQFIRDHYGNVNRTLIAPEETE